MPIGPIIIGAAAALGAIAGKRAGNAERDISQVNARSEEYISELNAQLTESTGDLNAELLDFNARVSHALALDATRRGSENAADLLTGVRVLVGSQRASYAAQGVDVDFGSPADVARDSKFQASVDAARIRTNAAREAWGLEVQSESDRRQSDSVRTASRMQARNIRDVGASRAQAYRMGGNAAASAATWNAAGTIVGAGGTLARAYGW